jgi:hypothetical protein
VTNQTQSCAQWKHLHIFDLVAQNRRTKNSNNLSGYTKDKVHFPVNYKTYCQCLSFLHDVRDFFLYLQHFCFSKSVTKNVLGKIQRCKHYMSTFLKNIKIWKLFCSIQISLSPNSCKWQTYPRWRQKCKHFKNCN